MSEVGGGGNPEWVHVTDWSPCRSVVGSQESCKPISGRFASLRIQTGTGLQQEALRSQDVHHRQMSQDPFPTAEVDGRVLED